MAHQDSPHDHHQLTADEPGFAPPTILTFLGPAENHQGRSSVSSPDMENASNIGKEDIVQNFSQGGEGDSAHGGEANSERSTGKNPATGECKGSLAAAADNDGDLKTHIITERERRRRMKDLFSNLQALMPHVPEKVDKATLVGETIHIIGTLEQTKVQLEKRKHEQALAWQAAAVATMSSVSASQTAQGMAAMSNGWGHVPRQQQPATSAAAMGPIGFQTWSAPNVVLSVSNNKGIINLCLPMQPRLLTVAMSVLSKHGIDVITVQVAADGGWSLITIYACVSIAFSISPFYLLVSYVGLSLDGGWQKCRSVCSSLLLSGLQTFW
ncbi:hypothetical protein HU200_038769 [Digitaria exilis]|uniref:BHLH domain-containing protein n=1 Tax=Digitaria exilis TaxID=1010633 RepID=A0A835EJZ0_9POAL|nr:hypothetical protein HU200_038769 [Digitaria exilis]